MFDLEMAVEDTIFRIKREYERTNGQIYLAFSGGKDSTVLANLIKMANLSENIPFVFVDTGIEMNTIKEFAKNFDYDNVVVVKPRKPYAQVIKEYGSPALSKLKSNALNTYQRHLDDPFKTARARQMITGLREKNGVQMEGRNSYKMSNKYMHFIHPDTEFKISNMCCQYMKKYPFDDFVKDNNMKGVYLGVRTAEGGARAITYDSCVKIKIKKGEEFYMSMPIIDWTNEMMDEFIEKYDIKLSDAYTVYGCTRTGCCGCPYSQHLKDDLKLLYDHEPLKYKAVMKWNKQIYMYQLIECDWDEEYMEEYKERLKIIEQRRQEMMEKFRPKKQ